MKDIEAEPLKEIITLPENAGLRDAYFAILKELYATNKDYFWLNDIISIISLDCGVTPDTAKDRVKQLVRFNLLKFLSSSLSGHRYLIQVYSAVGDAVPILIDDWEKFNRLVTEQFGGIVEPGLTKIRRSMNTSGQLELRESAQLEVKSELNKLDNGAAIHPGEDIIKSEFKTVDKMSIKQLVQEIENSNNNHNSDITVESPVLGEE